MNNSRVGLHWGLFVLVLAISACSQGTVNIGEQRTAQTKTGLDAYVANWVGYVEAKTFLDGADTVRITVTDAGTGTIRFGDRDLWPPVSDPNAMYPGDFAEAAKSSCPPTAIAWDGFLHSLRNLHVEQERLRASAASDGIFDSWCRLQQPIKLASGAYSCIKSDDWILGFGPRCVETANYQAPPDTVQNVSGCSAYQWIDATMGQYQLVGFPCMQASLCYDHSKNDASNSSLIICVCTESGCQLGDVPIDIVIDTALDATQQNMTGTLVIGTTNYAVRLKRQ